MNLFSPSLWEEFFTGRIGAWFQIGYVVLTSASVHLVLAYKFQIPFVSKQSLQGYSVVLIVTICLIQIFGWLWRLL